MKKQLAHRI